jgi:hypothetical protein
MLKWSLNPIPSIYITSHSTVQIPPSSLPVISNRKLPLKRIFQSDELDKFRKEDLCNSFSDFSENHCPNGFSFSKQDNSVTYHRIEFTNGVPKVKNR